MYDRQTKLTDELTKMNEQTDECTDKGNNKIKEGKEEKISVHCVAKVQLSPIVIPLGLASPLGWDWVKSRLA